ncbi:MAG: hypothetical protein DMG84_23265 [Acidobacteria bacterium]|nr:MAG: hypothetical protein DMG84_23265 [Acidobacteriota bacterium]
MFTDGTLVITVKVKKITKIFCKIPNCGDRELDGENEWHSGWVMGICRTVSRHRSSSRSNAWRSKIAKSIDTPSCRRLRQLRRGPEPGAHIQTVPRQLQQPRQQFSQGFRNLSGLPLSRLKAYIAKEITWQTQEP